MVTYRTADPISPLAAAALAHLPPLQQQLLYTRGIASTEAAAAFLEPSYDAHLHDPFLLPDMEKAVERILAAMEQGEIIAIYSDYDCDGIPGGVILHDLFTAIEYAHFINHIPHRHFDGFGLHTHAVEALHEKAVSLIITVDCGTTDVRAVARARELGVDVIITDHHQPGTTLPEAFAIINPQLDDTYPFKGICGAAVAFKLAQAILARGAYPFIPGREKWWLDMVGLATIADMVPLVDENRVFAHYGLRVLRKTRRPGLQQLLRGQRIDLRTLSEDDIGFTIAPRINAASRMDTPEDAFLMLASVDEGVAGAHAQHLEKLNVERKGIVAAMTREAHQHLKALMEIPPVIVLGNPLWRPSLAGLVANKLAEEHGRPAFVWGRDGNGKLKGSCRSGGSVSVHTLMEAAASYFSEYGGHHFSGGFGIKDDAVHQLPEALANALGTLKDKAVVDTGLLVDHVCTLEALTMEVLNQQQQLAPFGVGNPKPLYRIDDAVPKSVEQFGKGKEHTKLIFSTNGIAREAIAFFQVPEQFTKTPKAGEALTLLAHLEQSTFMGRRQVRLRIVDVV